MRKYFHRNWILLVSALIVSLLFCYPYLCKDLLGIEQDTFFHLSRIEGLAKSISRSNFFPEIYPYKNNGYGYASPSFYCDLFLIVPALMYLAGVSLSVCYKFTVFAITFFTFYTMAKLLKRITHKNAVSIIVAFAYIFCNYRITDVYVRGALGEVMAMIFLPVVLSGLYEILEQKNQKYWGLLCVGLLGLIFSHNITFLFGVVLVILFSLIYLKSMQKQQLISLCKAAGLAFLLSAWFTLPMIEQMMSQSLYVDYYASSSDLASNAMPLKQYLQNFINFGQGGYALPSGELMTLNPGVFLTLAPLLWFFLPKREKKSSLFIKASLILGIIFYLLPSDLIPWDSLAFLRVIQFPWRLMTLATVLLCIPAAKALSTFKFFQKKSVLAVLSCLLIAEGIYHLVPATQRTFGITSENTYEDITDGEIIDPYYSAFYVRVELAGADYLPSGSPDFRGRSTAIKSKKTGADTDIEYTREGTKLSFSVSESEVGDTLILPLTWYKGYQVYEIKDGKKIKVTTTSSSEHMVSFQVSEAGDYICVYERTPLRVFSLTLSLVTLIGVAVIGFKKQRKNISA